MASQFLSNHGGLYDRWKYPHNCIYDVRNRDKKPSKTPLFSLLIWLPQLPLGQTFNPKEHFIKEACTHWLMMHGQKKSIS